MLVTSLSGTPCPPKDETCPLKRIHEPEYRPTAPFSCPWYGGTVLLGVMLPRRPVRHGGIVGSGGVVFRGHQVVSRAQGVDWHRGKGRAGRVSESDQMLKQQNGK